LYLKRVFIQNKNKKMEKNDFIEKFEQIFDDVTPGTLNGSTLFREIEEWNSLMALALIAMVDDEFNISLNGADIRNSNTIEDLYNVINNK
jgi:acyl carrier protein